MKAENYENFKGFENSIRLFSDIQVIIVPKKVEEILRKKRFEKELSKIHKDISLAIEYCLLFLSNFTSIELDYNNIEKWKALSSKILLQQIPGSDGRYVRVIEFLSSPIFSLSPAIPLSPLIHKKLNEKGKSTYEAGKISKQYKLSTVFSKQGFVKYIIESNIIKEKRRKINDLKIRDAIVDPIAKNLLLVYPKITLPTEEEIFSEAQHLAKTKKVNNKGKILTIMKGQKKSDFVNFETRRVSYEDSLKSYKYLTDNGLIVPTISGDRAGGRVCDSFNLMPSFIRNLIKIDKEKVVTVDFKCLHPNLSIKLYNGKTKYLTHELIAKKLKINLRDVKLENLSFFNKRPKQMEQSILFEYYKKNEREMLDALIEDKNRNGYKITSQKMFELEVKIIAECIQRLNDINIYPLYIFDALLVKISNHKITEQIMNDVIIEMGIYTRVGN